MDDRESRELFMTLDETNLKKVCGAALNHETSDLYKRSSAWAVLNKACKLVNQSEKPKNDRDLNDSGDSDDIIVKHDSDEEQKDGETASAETALSSAFWELLNPLTQFFENAARQQLQTLVSAYSPETSVPLGQERLLALDLL